MFATAVLLFGLGVGWNVSFVAATAQMVDLTAVSERGRLIGFNDLLSALLGASLALLGGYALDSIGVAALAIGATVIVAAPVLWLASAPARRNSRLAEYSVAPPRRALSRRLPLSHLLARVARSLTHHWVRGLIAALVVLFGLMVARQHGRQGRRRLLRARHRDPGGDRPAARAYAGAGGRRLDARLQRRERQDHRSASRAPRSRARWRG